MDATHPTTARNSAATQWLLNIGHAIDHMFLLIFATAVTSIAGEFGMARWEDLMPYGVAAFFFFGIGSLPAGRLGDHWGRRKMMVVFFFGMGAAALLVSATQSPLQMALALAVMGCFASIYHPVGIPMLVQGATRPGWTIGINGLVGNLGIAVAAITTGLLVKYLGWRMAFAVPGALCIAFGCAFALLATREQAAPARKKAGNAALPPGVTLARLLLVMTVAASSGSLLFNFSTNSNYELLADRLRDISQDPARIGALLAAVYAAASLTQLVVGHLIDRVPLKALYLGIVCFQAAVLALSIVSHGWMFYAVQFLFMAAIFGAIPFTDAMIVRFVDDSARSRVSGMRLAVSFSASSIAVWLIGPVVKQAGFAALLGVMTATSILTLLVVSQLPATPAPARREPSGAPQGKAA
ncbi:MFS transporter [Ramlibacter algicola]|uniref:MFS transporter n=1 Tax=Ramlibacter algicola TaxID=2795217 RepID=A0A934Q072_9BURK|nr:MFS transporter [Ramlibacter algicola]MBK0392237.1 MFS transporter [Ramlibacter algicola]